MKEIFSVLTSEEFGYVVVADDKAQARKFVQEEESYVDSEGRKMVPLFIDDWEVGRLNIPVDNFSYGVIPPMKGLEMGAYGYIDDICPRCNREGRLENWNEGIMCESCYYGEGNE